VKTVRIPVAGQGGDHSAVGEIPDNPLAFSLARECDARLTARRQESSPGGDIVAQQIQVRGLRKIGTAEQVHAEAHRAELASQTLARDAMNGCSARFGEVLGHECASSKLLAPGCEVRPRGTVRRTQFSACPSSTSVTNSGCGHTIQSADWATCRSRASSPTKRHRRLPASKPAPLLSAPKDLRDSLRYGGAIRQR
jgi:hypothetical protein